jgi:exodeoxyribonuclease VII small subunit
MSNTDLANLPFEKALQELESIVQKLERSDISLDESITAYERGEKLKTHCEALLRAAEMRIEKIVLSRDGKPIGVEPLDPA